MNTTKIVFALFFLFAFSVAEIQTQTSEYRLKLLEELELKNTELAAKLDAYSESILTTYNQILELTVNILYDQEFPQVECKDSFFNQIVGRSVCPRPPTYSFDAKINRLFDERPQYEQKIKDLIARAQYNHDPSAEPIYHPLS